MSDDAGADGVVPVAADCTGVVFGGDWSVVLLASSYRRWVETLDALTAGLTPEAKRKLWAENARKFYRLKAL